MKNPLLILAVILVSIVSGFILFTFSAKTPSQTDSGMTKSNSLESQVDSTTSADEKVMEKDSNPRYVEYSKTVLDSASEGRRVLYFYANWCPTCRPADNNFKENTTKIPRDVILIRVNYNDSETSEEEKDLAKKYGVTYQHTFVQIDKDGKEVAKWNGGQIENLMANLK